MMWLHRLIAKAAQWWLDEVCSSCWRRASQDGLCLRCKCGAGRLRGDKWLMLKLRSDGTCVGCGVCDDCRMRMIHPAIVVGLKYRSPIGATCCPGGYPS